MMLREQDFSHFDRVRAPMMIFSSELEFLYANDMAQKCYPFLATSRGLERYYPKDVLATVSKGLTDGRAVRASSGDSALGDMMFVPAFAKDGGISHVCVYVEFEKASSYSFSSLTDEEILRFFHRGFEPVGEAICLLNRISHMNLQGVDPLLTRLLHSVKERLLASSVYMSRSEHSVLPETVAVCNASAALSLCASRFSAMRYKQDSLCYVPMSRPRFLNVVTDILSTLYVGQASEGVITVTAQSFDGQVEILFSSASGPLPTEASLCMDSDPLFGEVFSIRNRLEQVGATMEVKPHSARRGVDVILRFPPIRFSGSDVVFGDSELEALTFSEEILLDYLSQFSAPSEFDS